MAEIKSPALRMEICKKCPFYAFGGRCKKCGCSLSTKVKQSGAKCPLRKW